MNQLQLISLMMFLVITSLRSYSQTTINYYYDSSGNRTSRVIDLGGGKGTGESDKSIVKKEEQVAQKVYTDQIAESVIRIYPNPADSEIKVEIQGLEESSYPLISIYDQLGKLRITEKNVATMNVINLSNLNSGIYYLIIKLKTGTTKWTIIKR